MEYYIFVQKWSRSSLLSDIAYQYPSGNSRQVSVPCLDGAVCDVRKYKCKGVMVCPPCPEGFRTQTHCSVKPASQELRGSSDMQSLETGMTRRDESIYYELIGRGKYCAITIFKREGNLTSLIRCRGNPLFPKQKGERLR